jgi:hypothetical protein
MNILDAIPKAFGPDYAACRRLFLDSAKAAGGSLEAHNNPNSGPKGEPLACDTAWFGPSDAGRVLVVVSATHGVEGFCGSGIQNDWLLSGGPSGLPRDTAILLIHALNPHGFAWLRRVTEEGCDLNRNGINFNEPLPENTGHDALVDCFVPADLKPETIAAADAQIQTFRAEHGEKIYQAARKAGQYAHAHSIFFGGFGPTWARQTLETIIERYELAERRLVTILDVHTGLGPHGHGEPICGHKRGTKGFDRVLEMYGDTVGLPSEGTSSSIPLHGTQREIWGPRLGDNYTYVALEFGTYQPDNGTRVLRADHWLHHQAELTGGTVDWADPKTVEIKSAIRKHYHPDSDTWKELVLWRGRQMIRQSLEGLVKFV